MVDPFALITKGNALESASNHWGAAYSYSGASVALRQRADAISSQLSSEINHASHPNDGTKQKAIEERRKVVSLYRAQSLEYLYKARFCLLSALQFENDQDRDRTVDVAKSGAGSLDPLCSMITDEERERRQLVFNRLFLGEDSIRENNRATEKLGEKSTNTPQSLPTNATNEQSDSVTNVECGVESSAHEEVTKTSNEYDAMKQLDGGDETDGRQQSILSRLANLNSSLASDTLPDIPPPFIAGSRSNEGGDNQHRLSEIQRGLQRLGVSLPSDSGAKSDLIADNISEEDQVKMIIQQARDEVQVERVDSVGVSSEIDTAEDDNDMIDENDSMFEGYEDEEDDIDALLIKAEKLVAKTSAGIDTSSADSGGGSSFTELLHIRRAHALLLEARLCLELDISGRPADNIDETALDADNATDATAKDGKENDVGIESKLDKSRTSNSTTLAARKKARERIEDAQSCLIYMLEKWT